MFVLAPKIKMWEIYLLEPKVIFLLSAVGG